MDNKMLHDWRPDHGFEQLRTRAEVGGHGGREYPRDAFAALAPPSDQDRRDILLRVVRISDALNQRLAL